MGKKVAIIACALGLPGEKGYSRFPYLANMLCEQGYDVDLYTSTFNHWEKAQRDHKKIEMIQASVPYNIILSYEPGYKKNIDLRRIISHKKLAKNIVKSLEVNQKKRFLTPIECERLNGFEDNWTIGMTDRMRYFCMGNALVVDLITEMGKQIENIEKLNLKELIQLELF